MRNRHHTRKQYFKLNRNKYKYRNLVKNIKRGGTDAINIPMASGSKKNIALSDILKSGSKKNPKLKFKIVDYDKENNKVKVSIDFKFPQGTFLSLKSRNVNTVNTTLKKLADTYFKTKKQKRHKDLLTIILNTFIGTNKTKKSQKKSNKTNKN